MFLLSEWLNNSFAHAVFKKGMWFIWYPTVVAILEQGVSKVWKFTQSTQPSPFDELSIWRYSFDPGHWDRGLSSVFCSETLTRCHPHRPQGSPSIPQETAVSWTGHKKKKWKQHQKSCNIVLLSISINLFQHVAEEPACCSAQDL